MTKRLPYEVGRTWRGADLGWSLFWAQCRQCGVTFPGFDWARNARWLVKWHVQKHHPDLVSWHPVVGPWE